MCTTQCRSAGPVRLPCLTKPATRSLALGEWLEAWIGTWKGPAFNSTANEIAIEEGYPYCHEGLETAVTDTD